MCTYNGSQYLLSQLDSIAGQTLVPAELIVCDDGSRDSTLEILENFSRSVSFPVKIHQNTVNLGSTKNFEKAISLCTGEYIALSDQDDRWCPDKLERLAAAFQENPSYGALFSDARLIDQNGRPGRDRLWSVFGFGDREQREFQKEGPLRLHCQREFITGATMIFRAALIPTLLPIPETWIHDGWLAWMVALRQPLGFIPECLIDYRVHSDQQAGVPSKNLCMRLSKLRASEASACARKADRFLELEAYIRTRLPGGHPRAATMVEELIGLCRERANLRRHPLQRLRFVAVNFPKYLRYTNGLRSIVRDLVRA